MPELTCALGPDSAGTVLTGLIQRARSTLDVAMYEVGPSYAWALAAASRRGVRVRLLLDDHPADGNASTMLTVVGAGGGCRVIGRGSVAAHWKLLNIDARVTAGGTGNLLWRDAPRDRLRRLPPVAAPLHGTREWWAVTDSSDVVQQAAAAIDAAWEIAHPPPRSWTHAEAFATPGDVGTPAVQVAPLDIDLPMHRIRLVVGGLAIASAAQQLVRRARSQVLITTPYIHAEAAGVRSLLMSVARAASSGVDARVLLGSKPRRRDAERLRELGAAVRWMDPAGSTRGHAKGMIADDVAVVSSANWSTAGLTRNWESALVLRSPPAAEYFAAAWERDWSSAFSLAEAV